MDDLPTPYISQMVTAMSKQWGPRSGEGTVGRTALAPYLLSRQQLAQDH